MSRKVKVEIRKIAKDFQTKDGILHVLKDVTFKVAHGEFVVLLGQSGCGKSTLLRILAGLERSSSGQVLIDESNISGPSRERGMVFQAYTSYPWRTVLKNVEFALEHQSLDLKPKERKQIARFYVDLVGLTEFENYYPKQLSGGMQQRVAIARALVAQPEVMLFDEPFGALDAITRVKMQEELQSLLLQAEESTVVFVTHDVEEAVFLADRIILMSPEHPSTVLSELQITGNTEFGTRIPARFVRDQAFKRSQQFFALRQYVESILRGQVPVVTSAESSRLCQR